MGLVVAIRRRLELRWIGEGRECFRSSEILTDLVQVESGWGDCND
jgi:hypothetical protein